jgi:glucokinase
MFGNVTSLPGQRLVIEASLEGAVRFAVPTSSAPVGLSQLTQVDVGALPTFTDALQQFQRQTGIQLRGLECAMAIAGAASGETLSLVRSRWTISRSGLEAMFGKPVMIMNDLAARAWGMKVGTANLDTLRGFGLPDLNRPGRLMMVMVEDGVNAAIIDVDRQGRTRVLGTEAGHLDFAPTCEDEANLANALRGFSPASTWEKLLMLDRQDSVWSQACPGISESKRADLHAQILGRYCVNLMQVYGAWQGVMITGTRGARLLPAASRSAFESAFTARRNFSRLIGSCPAWHVDQRDAVLMGLAECLSYMEGPSTAEMRYAV